jgi:hypothetical protein
MAWQILTLAIGCHHVGARVQAKNKWGASRRPIVSWATRSGFLLGCWLRGFYLLFTYSLWGRYLEGRLRQVGAAAARSVPERPSRARRRHIRCFTELTRLTGPSAQLPKKWLSTLIRLES